MQKNPTARRRARTLLRATPVAAAVAATLCTSGLAQAQTTPSGVTDTVIITGIRRGIESAISVKKNADSIVEAISAEDLGKLPDTSIAESISRLPGVAAQRTGGRASQISIRGMAPDFSTTLLNGREQASVGDSRSVEFDQYPSELSAGVLIYKTPDGALVGQGLSGTVDMQSVRPLERSGREVALSYRKNKLNVGAKGTEGDGDRFSVLYVDQFADRTIGLALGFARLDEKGGVTSRFESWGNGQAQLNGAGPNLNVPYNGFNAWADQESRKRDGASATVQFKPSKNFSSTLDLFYSTFDKVKTNTGFQAPLNDAWNGNPGDYDSGGVHSGGVLTQATVSGSDANSGTFNKVRAVVRNDSTSEKDKIKSIGWNNKFKIGEDWSINADLSKSNSKRDGGIIETTAGTAQSALGTAQLDSVAYTNAGQFTPGLNYTDRSIIKLTDVQQAHRRAGLGRWHQLAASRLFQDLQGRGRSHRHPPERQAQPVSGPHRGSRRRRTRLRPRVDAHLHRRPTGDSGRRTGFGDHARRRHDQYPHARGLGDGGQLRLVLQHRLHLWRGPQAAPGHLQQGLDDQGEGHHGLCQG